ncbi:AbiH family protein, partial [Listeria booriae]|uniref:AbiH family protein n=1 Tax=Listeria booriae TaxID=1552123 RepID=UPI0017DB2B3A
FDIQSDLQSRFIDFYKDRIKTQFKLAFEKGTYNLDNNSLEKLQLKIPITAFGGVKLASSEATPISWPEQVKRITFWDLIMIFSFEKQNDINWCNIEECIKGVASTILTEYDGGIPVRTVDEIVQLQAKKINGSATGDFIKMLEMAIEQKFDKYSIFMSVINKLNEGKYTNTKIDEFLLSELYLYEKSFKYYIQQEVVKDNDTYKTKKSELLDKISIRNPMDTNVLNFNYTLNEFSSSKIKPEKLTTTNIHGSIIDEVIFGIDHSSVQASSRIYPFTKTFRKLITADFHRLSILKKDIQHIIFYGHSLGSADYSYFQSIFDSL